MDSDERVWGWGDNDFGQIQPRTQFNRTIVEPVQIEDLQGVAFGGWPGRE